MTIQIIDMIIEDIVRIKMNHFINTNPYGKLLGAIDYFNRTTEIEMDNISSIVKEFDTYTKSVFHEPILHTYGQP
jgi:hypothetical protein